MKTTIEITDVLESMNDSDLLVIWNEYQDEISGESQVFDFDDEFFETYFSSPQDAARAVFFGKIESWNAKHIMFNGYGNLEASNYLSDMISIYDLANHIEANQDQYEAILDD